jgi:3-dehydroquinate synthase
MLELMRVDKKSQEGAVRFVVLAAPGRAAVQRVPDEAVCSVIAGRRQA